MSISPVVRYELLIGGRCSKWLLNVRTMLDHGEVGSLLQHYLTDHVAYTVRTC